MKAEADRTEAEMQRTEDEIVTHEKGIGNLRGRLRRMGSKDSLYVCFKDHFKSVLFTVLFNLNWAFQ